MATSCGRDVVRATWHPRRRDGRRCGRWRRGRRRGGVMAGALAVEHVLDVHEAALVRVLVDCGRRRRHERVRAIRARRQRHHLGALEEAPVVDHGAVRCKVGTVRPQAQRAALAVHLHTIDRRAHHVLVGSVVVGVVDRYCQVALPLRGGRRRRRSWRRSRRGRGSGWWRRVAARRRGR